MRTISLCEYESAEVGDTAGRKCFLVQEIEALDRAQKAMGADAFKWVGRNKIKATQFVGIVAGNNIRLEVLPKIKSAEITKSRAIMMKMICGALDIPVYDGELTKLAAQNKDLLEILISIYAHRLIEEVRRGLTRNYQRHSDDLSRLRGKLNVTRQFTHLAATPQKLSCQFDEFSSNNPLNRLLLCATQTLRRHSTHAPTQRLLSEIETHFEDVETTPVQTVLADKITLNRNNNRWATVEKLGRLLLEALYQTTHSGKHQGIALLFDMNRLFEAYIARLAQKTLRPLGFVVLTQKPQKSLASNSDGGRSFITKPDLHIERDGIVFVLDTKWKRLDTSKPNYGISQADAYQMHGYSRVYEAISTVLIFPEIDGIKHNNGIVSSWDYTNSTANMILALVDILDEEKIKSTFLSLVSNEFASPHH